MKLSVCVEMIFTDLPFVDRVAAVAEAGYPAYEFWGWRNKDLAALKQAAQRHGLSVAGCALDARAVLVDPAVRSQLVADSREAFAAAREIGCPTLFVTSGNERAGVPRQEQHVSIIEGLRAIAPDAEAAGATVVLEPLNILVDHAGCFLASSDEAAEIVREVHSPAVRLLFDIYHQQITEGNVTARLEAYRDLLGHVHLAGVPGRHEPEPGELNYPFLLDRLRAWGYAKYVGLEYKPVGNSRESIEQSAQILGGTGR